MDPDIHDHYAAGAERPRLTFGHGRLEFLRTQELLLRHLPAPPATILDVGGGPGGGRGPGAPAARPPGQNYPLAHSGQAAGAPTCS